MERNKGFSLIELMVVVAIIGILAMIAVPSFNRYLAKAKRTEAYVNLSAIYAAQKAYCAEHGCYTGALTGPGSLSWEAATNKSTYTYSISQADSGRFVAQATGDIDGDGTMDILSIDQNNAIIIVQDDLA